MVTFKGVVFAKPHNNGIRPVPMAETLLWLTAKVGLTLLPDTGTALVGVGIQGGAENIGHAINAALGLDPDNTAILSRDWSNTFNSISHEQLFKVVDERYPALLPFITLMYGAHSVVQFFPDHPSGPVSILSSSGVRQGDPLGPFLFGIVMLPPLGKLHSLTRKCNCAISPASARVHRRHLPHRPLRCCHRSLPRARTGGR
jgi:Reverse transcriptase (RNA-dependent DNA polymerase)